MCGVEVESRHGQRGFARSRGLLLESGNRYVSRYQMLRDQSHRAGFAIGEGALGGWSWALGRLRAPLEASESAPPPGDISARFALIVVAGLVVAAFVVRMWLLHTAIAGGTFTALDPDGYMRQGRELARDGQGWQWTLDAIRYRYHGRTYLLPPLYPVFLSLFAVSPESYPNSAAVGQVALNSLSVAMLFVIGASLHSRRAGVLAAFVYAFWIPNIWTLGQFLQEQIYLPLLLAAFALLLRATSRCASPAAFACAGAAFGLAALTRSMPFYFVIMASIGYAVVARSDPRAPHRAAALVAGFFLVTGAYSLWVSEQLGQFVFIENHGGISIHNYGGGFYGVLGFRQIVELLFESFRGDPGRFFDTWVGFALALFNLHGDRWLQHYQAASATGATVAKIVAHAGIDVPFAVSVVLAPLGAVLARRSREAALLALWVALVVVLSALSGAGGIRYRAPFEPHLIALASVVLVGQWRRPGRTALIVGALTVVAAVSILVPQVSRVARGRANYGDSEWSLTTDGRRTWARAGLGFNVLPRDGIVQLRLYDGDDPVSPDQPTRVSVRIDGKDTGDHLLARAPLQLRFLSRDVGYVFVEVSATDAAGKPARIGVEVPN